jgi:hypothetical protein
VVLTPSDRPEHGDWTTNAALQIAKPAGNTTACCARYHFERELHPGKLSSRLDPSLAQALEQCLRHEFR